MKKTLKAWRFLLGCVLLVVAFAFFHLVVADYLATDIAALRQAMRQLRDLGAIEFAPPHGLRIRDLEFLEYIADAPATMLLNRASKAKTVPPPLPRQD